MHPAFVLRTIGEVCATFFFITALAHMPIANITAVLQVLPLTITLGAALVLKETIGWRRYIAIGIGFLGVLFIIRPGTEGFNIYALSALAATFFVTLRDLATRKLPSDTSSVFTSLCTGFSIFLFGAMGCLFYEWSAINNLQLVLLACAGVILAAAYLLSVLAVREGDIGFVSPFRYSILIWALLLGYFVFGDIPDTLALFGAALVVGSGLFTFYRERLLK